MLLIKKLVRLSCSPDRFIIEIEFSWVLQIQLGFFFFFFLNFREVLNCDKSMGAEYNSNDDSIKKTLNGN